MFKPLSNYNFISKQRPLFVKPKRRRFKPLASSKFTYKSDKPNRTLSKFTEPITRSQFSRKFRHQSFNHNHTPLHNTLPKFTEPITRAQISRKSIPSCASKRSSILPKFTEPVLRTHVFRKPSLQPMHIKNQSHLPLFTIPFVIPPNTIPSVNAEVVTSDVSNYEKTYTRPKFCTPKRQNSNYPVSRKRTLKLMVPTIPKIPAISRSHKQTSTHNRTYSFHPFRTMHQHHFKINIPRDRIAFWSMYFVIYVLSLEPARDLAVLANGRVTCREDSAWTAMRHHRSEHPREWLAVATTIPDRINGISILFTFYHTHGTLIIDGVYC